MVLGAEAGIRAERLCDSELGCPPREARGPVQGQQLGDLAGGMSDDADQDVGKVFDHVDAGLTLESC